MEICARPRRRRDGAGHVPKQVRAETAVGFRIKSGWAAVVSLTGSVDSPQLCDNRLIDLYDSRFPETRQPYHAAMGKLETDTRKVNWRVRMVRCIAQQ